jgi:hypothetical protein
MNVDGEILKHTIETCFVVKLRDSVPFSSPGQTIPWFGVKIKYALSSLIIYCLMLILWWSLL